jgi:hypothetical protein
MRDDDRLRGIPETEAQQPDPMLDEQPAGPARIGVTLFGAAALVALVMYALSRPEPQQTAAAPEAAQSSAPATTGQAATPQAQPSTTGQGQGQGTNQASEPPKQAQPGRVERSDSATTGPGSAPSDKAAAPSDQPAAPARN